MSAPNYEVVQASVLHVKPLASCLRPAACITVQMFDLDVRQALRSTVRRATYARTALLDGHPVAMWGMEGPALSDRATAWAAFGEPAVRFPLAIMRRARSELGLMREKAGDLYAFVGRNDERALLFARSLGFEFVNGEGEDPRFAVMMLGRS